MEKSKLYYCGGGGRGARLAALDLVEEDVEVLGLLAKVADDRAGARDDLLGVAVLVNLAEANPFAELLGVGHLDELDGVLGAEGLDEAHILLLLTALGEHAELGGAHVERLYGLAEAARKPVVVEGAAEDFAEGILHRDGAAALDGGGVNFGYGHLGNDISFCRHGSSFLAKRRTSLALPVVRLFLRCPRAARAMQALCLRHAGVVLAARKQHRARRRTDGWMAAIGRTLTCDGGERRWHRPGSVPPFDGRSYFVLPITCSRHCALLTALRSADQAAHCGAPGCGPLPIRRILHACGSHPTR